MMAKQETITESKHPDTENNSYRLNANKTRRKKWRVYTYNTKRFHGQQISCFYNQTELTVDEVFYVQYLKPVTDLMINNILGRECYKIFKTEDLIYAVAEAWNHCNM